MYCYNCMHKLTDTDTFCRHCGRTSVPDRTPHHLAPGTVLNDRYMIGNALGEDGFSITYIGRDLNLGLRVSVKEYYPMGYVSRDDQAGAAVQIHRTPEDRAFVREGTDKFIEEARQSQDTGADIRDIFAENNTAYVVTAMPREQSQPLRPHAAAYPNDDYGDDFDGSDSRDPKDSADISGQSANGKKPPQKKKAPVGLIIGASVAAVLVIALVVFFLVNGKKSKGETAATTVPATAAATTVPSTQASKEEDDTVTVPDTRGMKLSDARDQLQSIGLKVEVSRENSSEVAKDYVIRQSAEKGQTLRKGDTVMLYVSDGAAEEPTTEEPHAAPEFDTADSSSTRDDGDGVSYDVYNLFNNDASCWSAAGGDNGEWVRFGANSDQWVKGVMLINGNARDDDTFRQNSRVTALRFEFSDGTSIEKKVEDTANLQYIEFGKEIKTSSIKMTVIGHHDGTEHKNISLTYVRAYL